VFTIVYWNVERPVVCPKNPSWTSWWAALVRGGGRTNGFADQDHRDLARSSKASQLADVVLDAAHHQHPIHHRLRPGFSAFNVTRERDVFAGANLVIRAECLEVLHLGWVAFKGRRRGIARVPIQERAVCEAHLVEIRIGPRLDRARRHLAERHHRKRDSKKDDNCVEKSRFFHTVILQKRARNRTVLFEHLQKYRDGAENGNTESETVSDGEQKQ